MHANTGGNVLGKKVLMDGSSEEPFTLLSCVFVLCDVKSCHEINVYTKLLSEYFFRAPQFPFLNAVFPQVFSSEPLLSESLSKWDEFLSLTEKVFSANAGIGLLLFKKRWKVDDISHQIDTIT